MYTNIIRKSSFVTKYFNVEYTYIHMKKFLKKNWGRILLFILLITICILSFSKGKYLLGNDNYSPELNPSLTIERSIESPAWRSYRVLGFGSESEQADIFRSMFFWVTEKVLPRESLGQVFALMCLFIGSWFIGELGLLLNKDFFKKEYSQLVFLLSSIIYITTLWTPWIYSFHMSPFVSQYGLLPLLLFTIYLYLREPDTKRLLLVFLSGILFSSSCVIATIFFVDIVLIVFFVIYFAFVLNKGKKFKKGLKGILKILTILLITQLFWLLPFMIYTVNNTGGIFSSYSNRSITANTIDLEREMLTAKNSARLYTRVLNTVADNEGTMLFSLSENYVNYDFYKVFSYIPIFFSVVGLIFLIVKKEWKLLIFWILAIVSWFLIKNGNAPIGGIYIWLQENIAIFRQVLRWVSSKLGNIYLFAIAFTSTFGIVFFLDFLTSFFKKKGIKLSIFVVSISLLLGLQLFYGEFLFTNNLFPERSLIEDIPDEYFKLGEYIEKEGIEQKRIYYAPPSNNGYFREYDWGFVGSVFLNYIIPNPLMDLSLAIGSAAGEKAIYELEDAYLSGDIESLKVYLEKYDVEYLLIDRNLTDTVYGYTINWDLCDFVVSTFDLKWESGNLELYTYKKDAPEILTLPDLNIQNPRKIDNYIRGTFVDLSYNRQDIVQDTLLSFVKVIGNSIRVYPAIPDLKGEEISLKYKEFPNTNSDYISINGFVLSNEDVKNGIGIDSEFGDIKNIIILTDDDFVETDLTDEYRDSIVGDCSTGEFVDSVSSKSEELASGFKLSGTKGLPCISNVFSVEKESMVKVSLDWETDGDSLAGICVYSYDQEKCLNSEKYLYTSDLIGKTEFILDKTIRPKENIEIFLYALDSKDEESEIIYREVTVSTVPIVNSKNITSSGYFIYSPDRSGFPVIKGLSYEYFPSDFIWQSSAVEDTKYQLSVNNGMNQEVEDGTVSQVNRVLKTNPLEKYIWYVHGENIENIPSTLCLYYIGDDKCWEPEILLDKEETYLLKTFTATTSSKVLEMSYMSTSFSEKTKNILKEVVVQRIPDEWFKLIEIEEKGGSMVEAQPLYNSPHSTWYIADISNEDTLAIPQAEDRSWIAFGKGNLLWKPISSEKKVIINNWKQAWDISDLEFNTILVIYWPNLLGYLGYGLIVVEGMFLTVKLFKKKKK